MHWQKITERTDCVSVGESMICIYHLPGNDVVLIDAGAVESPEFVEQLEERGLNVRAILCTHLHFDHISTAGLIYNEYNMPSYASHLEHKEPIFPTREFPVTPLYDAAPIVIEGERFEVLPTPGHTKGHLAFVTPDGVCCVGDTFISEKPLAQAKIPYMIDVEQSIASMELIRATDYNAYLLSHDAVIVGREELSALIDANIDKELELYEMIKRFVTEPMPVEDMITAFMKHCGIRSNFILNDHGYRDTVKSRVISLDYAGELRLEGQWVMPVK